MLTQPHGADLIAFWHAAGALTTKKKPRRSGCQTGASWDNVKGANLHHVMLSELRALQRVLRITMQCKHASQKEKPREGTGLSGRYRVNECGNYAKAGITTPCVNKGDNSRILVQCDIGATEAGTEADASIPFTE